MSALRWKRAAGLILGVVMVAVMVAGCGSGEYGEIEDIISDKAKITESYITDLEKADNAEDVAEAINEFTDGMKTLIPKIKAYQETNPEIWIDGDDVPEKIKAQQARLEAANEKVQGAFMNMMTYMMDSKVQEAMMNMGVEIGKME